MKQNIIIYYG